MNENTRENIAETLGRLLPKAEVLEVEDLFGGGQLRHFAVPKGFDLKTIDNEATLENPRRIKATAKLADAESFVGYVESHVSEHSAVWCTFDPVSYALSFEAVLDEHGQLPGWRQHRAVFTPRLSVEWNTWLKSNATAMGQLPFAEFIEGNEKDIAGGAGFPSSLEMQKMATAFEANADNRFKSKIRTASGGVELQFVNTDDEATVERMKLFERFQIGLPVFWSLPEKGKPVPAWPIEARLKYRVGEGVVRFHYELIRPDLVHQLAALELIDRVRTGLGNTVMHMGSCS